MLWTSIFLAALLTMIVFDLVLFGELNLINKKILFEDKIQTHLDKTLKLKKFKRLFKQDFEPYLMKNNSSLNIEIYNDFMKIYEKIKTEDMTLCPKTLSFVFLSNVEGYVTEKKSDNIRIITRNDLSDLMTKNAKLAEYINRFFEIQYNHAYEYDINGTVYINGRYRLLSDLTSIVFEGIRNEQNKEHTNVYFNFGPNREKLTFDSFTDAFKYIFKDKDADIRMIQKISNYALTIYEEGVL